MSEEKDFTERVEWHFTSPFPVVKGTIELNKRIKVSHDKNMLMLSQN